MAIKPKMDSNATEIAYAEEDSLGVLPGTPTWRKMEPNSYADFGGNTTTVPRRFINASRQLEKGVAVDFDASGGLNTDLTQDNMQRLIQGYLFAAMRTKAELAVAVVDGPNDEFEPAAGGDGYVAGDLLFAKGFADAANNGLHLVTGSPTATAVEVTSDLAAATGQSGTISRVGYQFGTGEVDIDVSGALPRLVRASGTKDFTTLGLIPGESVVIGDDGAGTQFSNVDGSGNLVNNGLKRVRQVGTTFIEFDKSDFTMTAETGTGDTIRIFFGRVCKNESDPTLIVRSSYQLERKLGAPESTTPAQIQAEYLVGAVPNTLALNKRTADKINADLQFVAIDQELRDHATGVKSGNRPTLVTTPAFNTSSHVARIRLASVSSLDEAPTPLVSYTRELTLEVNNGITPDKAIGVFGAFDVTAGSFQVTGNLVAYFSTISSVAAVKANADVTLDFTLARGNQGITFDIPLLTLGEGRLAVALDEPITIPLGLSAARAASVAAALDHTLFITFWDYLPDYLAG